MEILHFKCKGNWDLSHGGDGSECPGRGELLAENWSGQKLCPEMFHCYVLPVSGGSL